MFCDLHMHSTASDGTVTPDELPAMAKAAGLSAIALTDHDTTAGLPACQAACETLGIAFVPGIELSVDPGVRPGEEHDAPRRGTLHILGLFIRHDDPGLKQIEHRMREARDSRNPAIVAKLQELGVSIDYREVLDLAKEQGTEIIGRPHIAQVLIRKGYVKSVQDAFTRYIAQGKPAYVRRDRLPATEAIDAIHQAGGLAVFAHPVQLGLTDPDELEYFTARLRDLGLDAVEVLHSDHLPALVRQYTQMAQKLGLLTSGGSDYHGSRKPVDLGSQRVPFAMYEQLFQARRRT
ncbi:MAG: PHP domain-containing protein [Phycisphaeraceae bacterium]|nr:PHP domain-containing protein [Phycisphaeraceae bacterium]